MKKQKFEKVYQCMGLCLKDGYNHVWGCCGETHTLMRWLELIYNWMEKDQLMEFFGDDYSAKDIIEYIYNSSSLRLVEVKK